MRTTFFSKNRIAGMSISKEHTQFFFWFKMEHKNIRFESMRCFDMLP